MSGSFVLLVFGPFVVGAAYTIRPPDSRTAVTTPVATTRGNEAKDWHLKDAVFLPGVFNCPLADEALLCELRAIDERARLKALAVRQRLEQPGNVELPELAREFEMMRSATLPLEAQHVGEETISWIQDAAEQCAADYLEFVGALLEAREYIEALQTERGMLKATLGKFGPYSLMRRVDELLGPAPAEARFACCTLARAHRPTVWHAFCSEVRRKLEQQEYRLAGGHRTRSYRSRTEWRLITRLSELGQPKRVGETVRGAGGRREARALRSLQYKQDVRSGVAQPVARLPPTRKQRAMSAVAAAVAAAKAKEERRAELLAKVQQD